MTTTTATITGIWTKAKAHPYETGIAVFVIGAIIIYVFFRGGSKAPAPAPTQPTGGVSEAQALQLSANNSANNAAATAASNQVAGAVTIAGLNADVAKLGITTGGAIGGQSIAAQQTLGLAGIGASRDINLASIDAGVSLAAIGTAGTVAVQKQLYDYLTTQLGLQTNIQSQQLKEQSDALNAVINLRGGGNVTPITSPVVPASAIAALYQQDLGRAPDPAGLAYYETQYNAGAITLDQINQTLLTSPEKLGQH